MRQTKITLTLSAVLMSMLLTACGSPGSSGTVTGQSSGTSTNSVATQPSGNANNNVMVKGKNGTTLIQGGKQYSGSANLKKFEVLAKQNPNSASAQIDAAKSAFVNMKNTLALQYYQKAQTLDPKNGEISNDIGNIYLRRLNDAKKALPYYEKATQLSPTYAYGWMNLAETEKQLGNMTAAKAAVNEGLKKVPKSDPLYKYISATLKG